VALGLDTFRRYGVGNSLRNARKVLKGKKFIREGKTSFYSRAK